MIKVYKALHDEFAVTVSSDKLFQWSTIRMKKVFKRWVVLHLFLTSFKWLQFPTWHCYLVIYACISGQPMEYPSINSRAPDNFYVQRVITPYFWKWWVFAYFLCTVVLTCTLLKLCLTQIYRICSDSVFWQIIPMINDSHGESIQTLSCVTSLFNKFQMMPHSLVSW
jgi:hypothetical protein